MKIHKLEMICMVNYRPTWMAICELLGSLQISCVYVPTDDCYNKVVSNLLIICLIKPFFIKVCIEKHVIEHFPHVYSCGKIGLAQLLSNVRAIYLDAITALWSCCCSLSSYHGYLNVIVELHWVRLWYYYRKAKMWLKWWPKRLLILAPQDKKCGDTPVIWKRISQSRCIWGWLRVLEGLAKCDKDFNKLRGCLYDTVFN